MKYALNLAEDGRILSATFERFIPKVKDDDSSKENIFKDAVLVEELPEGSISDYLYVDGEFVHDPLPKPEIPENTPSQLDRVEAQVTYTAMMTDTLLEV